jgi:hypothetical protein
LEKKLNAEVQSSQREDGLARRWRVLLYVAVSVLALVPCFWLPQIEAGDLGSHSYNAWLTSLVLKGQAPGLWVAPQTNNILFDILLLRFGSLVGFAAGEKIAVCLAVLIFSWGAFAFVSAVAEAPAWFLLPLLLMLTYGWTFHMGFFNFYLALGLSFVGFAILWSARRRWYLYAVALGLAVPIWMAHPLGLAWYVVVAAYVLVGRRLAPRVQALLAGAAVASALALHFYLARAYPVQWWRGQYLDLLGTDQLVLGARYEFVAWLVLLLVAACVLLHVLRERAEQRKVWEFTAAAQLFVVGVFALALLPDAIRLPWYNEPISLLTSRFTLAVAVVGCAALARLRPRFLFAALSGAVALAYFVLVYQDAAKTYRLEAHAEELIARLEPESRVVTTVYPFRGFRIFVHHVVDRACIGRCFNVDNYEPSSNAFRLRANTGNRIVSASEADANHMMLGDYVVRPEDLPLWQIFQCGPKDVDLCLRPLHEAPMNQVAGGAVQRAQ